MSAYDSIIKGLNEAVQYENCELQKVKVDRVVIASLHVFTERRLRQYAVSKK